MTHNRPPPLDLMTHHHTPNTTTTGTATGTPRGQKIGYARVSTTEQNLERQTHRLHTAGCHKIFTDHTTGATHKRPGLARTIDYLRDGDHLIVVSMDRLARSLIDLNTLINELVKQGVTITFLTEKQTYSQQTTPIAQLMLGLLGAVAEFERAIIRERQADGIARAKARGAYRGRPKLLTDTQIAQAHHWATIGIPKADIARRLGIGRSTVYRYLKTTTPPTTSPNRSTTDKTPPTPNAHTQQVD